jgi:hypothetical protein
MSIGDGIGGLAGVGVGSGKPPAIGGVEKMIGGGGITDAGE